MRTFIGSALGALFGILLLVVVAAGVGGLVASRDTKIRDHSWLLVDLQEERP